MLFLLSKEGVKFRLMHTLLGKAEVLGPVSDIPVCVLNAVSWLNYSTTRVKKHMSSERSGREVQELFPHPKTVPSA